MHPRNNLLCRRVCRAHTRQRARHYAVHIRKGGFMQKTEPGQQPGHKTAQKRREERVSTQLPVYLGGATGRTRDVSASGILFKTDASYALGSSISFAVELDTSNGKMVMRCRGDIVRIEPKGSKVGVAVKITESTLEPATP